MRWWGEAAGQLRAVCGLCSLAQSPPPLPVLQVSVWAGGAVPPMSRASCRVGESQHRGTSRAVGSAWETGRVLSGHVLLRDCKCRVPEAPSARAAGTDNAGGGSAGSLGGTPVPEVGWAGRVRPQVTVTRLLGGRRGEGGDDLALWAATASSLGPECRCPHPGTRATPTRSHVPHPPLIPTPPTCTFISTHCSFTHMHVHIYTPTHHFFTPSCSQPTHSFTDLHTRSHRIRTLLHIHLCAPGPGGR